MPPARQISQEGDGVAAQAIFEVKADAVLGKTIPGNSPSGSDPSGNDVCHLREMNTYERDL